MIRFKFLMDNKTDRPGCVAEHGLSIYVEAHGRKLLFDTGASDLFIQNAQNLEVGLEAVEAVIISHGHYDHTGGVPAFCKLNKTAPLYIHKDAFEETYGQVEGRIDQERCSILWKEDERKEINPRISLTERVRWISDDIVISGTIASHFDQKPTEIFYIKKADGTYVEDSMNHEQMLIIRESEGIYIFSGCSHKGVVAAIQYAREIFPRERIAALIAGMHLYDAGAAMRQKVVSQIIEADIGIVMPVHCTGIDAICDLKAALGDRCMVPTAGGSYGY